MTPEVDAQTIVVESAPVQALAALFDDGLATPRPGDLLPPLWHWVALPRWSGAGDLGADGHPTRRGPLASIPQPRRMFAGGSIELIRPILVGDTVQCTTRVVSIVPKSGRSGEFTLATVEHDIRDRDGRMALRETQDLVYRAAAEPGGLRTPDPVDPVPALLERTTDDWLFRTDPTRLMQFSAATANGHRIHYDWPYATLREGYFGLVVHGPLMTLSVLETARLDAPSRQIRRITHRNLSPLFCGQEARIGRTASPDRWTAGLRRGDEAIVAVSIEFTESEG